MAKNNNKAKEVEEKKVPEAEEAKEAKPEEAKPEEAKPEEAKPEASELVFPEVAKTGKFQSVAVGEGFVVYNPDGIRVTEVITKIAADDMVRNQNQAAHIK